MRLLFIVITLCINIYSLTAQDICEHTTEGNPNANTLKLKIVVPCSWSSEYNNVPFGVGKFIYKQTGLMATMSLVIGNILAETTEADAKKLLTSEGLKLMTKGRTQYGKTSSFKINEINGGEIILKDHTDDKFFYAIQDYFVYNRKLVLIQYTVASKNDSDFTTWKPFFRKLLQQTKFAKL